MATCSYSERKSRKRGDIRLPLPASLELSSEFEGKGVRAPSVVRWSPDYSEYMLPPARDEQMWNMWLKPLCDKHLAREAVLLTFCDPLPQQSSRLKHLSNKEWKDLLNWLDISGMALYFLDRIIELQLYDWLPSDILARLQENLKDNTARTLGMIAESAIIQEHFQKAHLSYANLKGLSFWPSSVPKPELRSQFDLDFLIAEDSVVEARQILERRGYRLYAVSGRSWEFKFNERPGISLKDLYKALPSHVVELHIESNIPGNYSPLEHVEWRELHGLNMPVLSSVDLFLGQGLHAYKHLCSEFSRTAHLLEFRRHILARSKDKAFWMDLQIACEMDSKASLKLGVVILLISQIMGEFAPMDLTAWTVQCLPQSVRLWVKIYGYGAIFGDFPGSKLYLLLQRELETAGVPAKRSIRKTLLPVQFPPFVIKAFPNESLSIKFGRYRMQLNFLLLRLRFHIIEGVRYLWESYRWQRLLSRLVQ